MTSRLPILILLGLLLVATPVSAAILINEDYEVANINELVSLKGWGLLNSFNQDGVTPSATVATCPAPRTGTCLLFNYQGNYVSENNNAVLGKHWSPAQEIYGRYYLYMTRFSPGTPMSFGAISHKQHYLKTDDVTGGTLPNGVSNHYSGDPRESFSWQGAADCPAPQGAPDCPTIFQNQGVDVAYQENVWYCVEYNHRWNDLGQSNGYSRLWIDGILVMNHQGRMFRSATVSPSSLWTNVQIFRQDGNNMKRYEDSFIMSTTPVGCDGSPPPPDVIAPTQPTGLSLTPVSSVLTLSVTNGTDNQDTNLNLRVERCTVTSGTTCANFSLALTVGGIAGQVSTFDLTGLASTTRYCVRVNNQDGSANPGPYSSTVCATTLQGTTAVLLQATNVSPHSDAVAVSISKVYASPITAASLLWGCTSHDITQSSTLAVSDNVNGAWTQAVQAQVVGDQAITLWYRENASAGATTVTATPTPQIGYLRLAIHEVSGILTSGSLDQFAGQTQVSVPTTNDAVTSGAVTTTQAEEYLAACTMLMTGQPTTVTAGTGFTQRTTTGTTTQLVSEDGGQTVIGSRAGTFTITPSRNTETVFATFKTTAIVPLPVVTASTVDTTGADLTYGATPPTFLRVQTFGTIPGTNVVYSSPSIRFTVPNGGWANGLQGVCFFGQNAAHVESTNPDDWQCDSLVGFTQTDLTPPVLSALAPSGTLAQGTTQTTISATSNEPADLRYDTVDVAYGTMALAMTTVDGLHHTATVTGLTNGPVYTYYVRGQDRVVPSPNANTTSSVITFAVSAPSDTTAPIRSGGSPSGARPSGTTSVSMTLQTNEAATCKYGVVPPSTSSTTYAALPNTFATTGSTTHSQTISGLVDGGSYTYEVKCLDAALNANTTSFPISWTVTPLPPDVSPPVRSAGAPSTLQAAGTTSVNMTLTTNENATCKYSLSPGLTFAAMPSTFGTTGGTSHSQAISPLVDGQVSLFHVRCRDAALNANTTDYIITWAIDVVNDATRPSDVTGVVVTPFSSSQATVVFNASTDDVAVTGYQATIGAGLPCTPSTILAQWDTSLTQELSGLTAGTTYCLSLVAGDAAGNTSLNPSTPVEFTMPTLGDPIRPSDVVGLVAVPAEVTYTSTGMLWTASIDNVLVAHYDLYRCTGEGCTDFGIKVSTSATSFTDTRSILAATVYRYIVYAVDLAGNASLNPSAVLTITTPDVPSTLEQGLCPCDNPHR